MVDLIILDLFDLYIITQPFRDEIRIPKTKVKHHLLVLLHGLLQPRQEQLQQRVFAFISKCTFVSRSQNLHGRFLTLFAHPQYSKSSLRDTSAFLVTFSIFQPSYAVCFSCKVWRICWSSKQCCRKISKGQEHPRAKHSKHRDLQGDCHGDSFLILA